MRPASAPILTKKNAFAKSKSVFFRAFSISAEINKIL